MLTLFLFATSVTSIKVFFFNSTDDNDPVSTAVLQSPRRALPEKFTLCFSMKEDKIARRSPLLIRDKDDKPWIALSIWNEGGRPTLWGEVGKTEWKMFHVFERPWKFWSHICTGIDTIAGTLSLSIDGQPSVTNTFEKLRQGKPTSLAEKLELGLTETSPSSGGTRPFRGKVSNVHLHVFNEAAESIEYLSKSPCKSEGTILAWSDMIFRRNGRNVIEQVEAESEVCQVKIKSYDILLPGKTSWPQADHLCKALGGGTITGVKDVNDIEKFTSQLADIPESCPTVWLPLTDEKIEGFWEDTNLNSEAKFLRWLDGQPNGLQTQNHAALFMENLHFGDFHAKEAHCASCTLTANTILTLRGVCKDSYLGRNSFSRKNVMKILFLRHNIRGSTR